MKVVYDSTTLCDGVEYDGVVGKFIGPLGRNIIHTVWDQAPRKYIGAVPPPPPATWAMRSESSPYA